MTMEKIISSICVLLAMLLAASAYADDFTEALARAYNYNPNIRIARAQLSATDQGVALALAARRPNISASISGGKAMSDIWDYSAKSNPSAEKKYHYTQNNYAIAASQPLYRGGGLDAQIEGAEAQVLATRANLQNTEQEVLLSAATVYLDHWLAQRNLVTQRENKNQLTQNVEINRQIFQRSNITVTDLSQTENRLAQAYSDYAQAENAVANAKINYQVVIGAEPDELAGLPDLKQYLPSLDMALSEALDANPAIKAAHYSKEAAEATIAAKEAANKPSLDLTYQHLKSKGSTYDLSLLDQDKAQVQLNVPIYQGGAVGANIRAAREQSFLAGTTIEKTRREIIQSTANAWHLTQSAANAVDNYRIQVASAELALKGVKIEMAHGKRAVIDTLNALQELINARLSLSQAERDYILTELQLLSAQGKLTASQMGLPTEEYDVLPHYEQTKARWLDQDWKQ